MTYLKTAIVQDPTTPANQAAVIVGPFTGIKGLRVYGGPTDPISDIPVKIEFDHHQLHEGELFRAQDVQSSLGNATVKYGITVPVFAVPIQSPHMVITADIYNGTVFIQLYEAATFTGGAALNIYNRNRNISTTPGASIKTGVTSTNGVLLDSLYVGSGSKASSSNRAAVEWVLKSNTIYRVDAIGKVAGTEAVIGFDWYEDLGV